MLTLELDMYQACALGALVYCLGRLLVQKLPFLSKYCIPAPVAGGVVFAFAHLALYATGVLELSFDTTFYAVSWRSRNEWFLRTASGAGIRSCRRNYSCPGIRYIWSGIRQYDGWSYRPCPC